MRYTLLVTGGSRKVIRRLVVRRLSGAEVIRTCLDRDNDVYVVEVETDQANALKEWIKDDNEQLRYYTEAV